MSGGVDARAIRDYDINVDGYIQGASLDLLEEPVHEADLIHEEASKKDA